MKVILTIVAISVLASALLIGSLVYILQSDNNVAKQEQVAEGQKTAEITKKDIREAVWEQLTSEQKKWIGGTWEDGTIEKDTVGEGYISYKPGVDAESYQGKEVYVVSFDNGLTGMFAIADIATQEIIGYYPYD